MRILLRSVVFALAMAVIASQATAEVTAKDDQQLTATGQKIDTESSAADSTKVTTKIVDQWKGTLFTFDKGGTPRELTAQDVQGFRQKGLGYGEITILLALGAKQPDATTAKSLNEILAMRQESGGGWGKLAKELGYSSLGSVIRSVKASDKALEKIGTTGRADKSAKVDKNLRVEKVEKVDRVDRPEKPMKPEKVERPERSGR